MPSNEPPTTAHPDPEVRPKAKRRQFTTEYKKRILEEADACATPAERGALVRREGLYSSHLNTWRRQRDQGILDGLGPKKRGPKRNLFTIENARLQRENERLKKQLQRAETIIEIQKKVSQLLGIPLAESPSNDETSSKR